MADQGDSGPQPSAPPPSYDQVVAGEIQASNPSGYAAPVDGYPPSAVYKPPGAPVNESYVGHSETQPPYPTTNYIHPSVTAGPGYPTYTGQPAYGPVVPGQQNPAYPYPTSAPYQGTPVQGYGVPQGNTTTYNYQIQTQPVMPVRSVMVSQDAARRRKIFSFITVLIIVGVILLFVFLNVIP